MCLVRVDDEAERLAGEMTAQHDLSCFVSVAGVKTEAIAKAKPFIKAEAIKTNAKTTIKIEASLSTTAAKLNFDDNRNSTRARSTSSNP